MDTLVSLLILRKYNNLIDIFTYAAVYITPAITSISNFAVSLKHKCFWFFSFLKFHYNKHHFPKFSTILHIPFIQSMSFDLMKKGEILVIRNINSCSTNSVKWHR